jgi:Type IV secretion system pilin
MVKTITLSVLFTISVFCAGLFALNPSAEASPVLFADAQKVVCDGAILIAGGDCDPATGRGLQKILKAVTTVFAWVLGILAVILIIFGGLKYVTSGGDSNKVSSAKNTILFAIVGLVVAAVAQPFVNFVISFFAE